MTIITARLCRLLRRTQRDGSFTQRDGSFVSASPDTKEPSLCVSGAKNKVVYNRHATEKQSAETVEASLSGEQDGTTPSTSMHTPIQQNVFSVGKDRKNSDTLQEKQ